MITGLEAGRIRHGTPSYFERGRVLGERAGIPPIQNQKIANLDRKSKEHASSLTVGYLAGLRNRLIDQGYSGDEVKNWFPEHPEPEDLNFLGRGLLVKAPGIAVQYSEESAHDKEERQRHSRAYALGLFIGLNPTDSALLRFSMENLPQDDGSYEIFCLRFGFGEYALD